MKRVIFFALIVFAGFSTVFFTGCKKQKESKLIGSWYQIPLTYAEKEDTVIWTFDNSKNLVLVTNDSIRDTASYYIKIEFFKYYVVISEMDNSNGTYRIEKLNKKIMILQCIDPFIRKEFTKEQ